MPLTWEKSIGKPLDPAHGLGFGDAYYIQWPGWFWMPKPSHTDDSAKLSINKCSSFMKHKSTNLLISIPFILPWNRSDGTSRKNWQGMFLNHGCLGRCDKIWHSCGIFWDSYRWKAIVRTLLAIPMNVFPTWSSPFFSSAVYLCVFGWMWLRTPSLCLIFTRTVLLMLAYQWWLRHSWTPAQLLSIS